MTKSRRLTASLAMLLVSALLLSTASYAWFAMNTQTKAEGLEVEAYTDSLFLEISDGTDGDDEGTDKDYSVAINYNMGTDTNLLLVTPSLFKDLEYVTIPTPTRLTEGNCTDTSAAYYKSSNGNYIRVTDLVATSSTADLYKNPTFTLVASNAIVEGPATYYEYDTKTHNYTAVEIEGESAYGYYALSGTKEGATAIYSGVATDKYYAEQTNDDGDTILVEVSASLTLGTSLVGLYTINANNVVTKTVAATGETYYVQNGNDFTFIGTVEQGTILDEHLFWGRAYSTLAEAVQEDNTLTLVGEDEAANYYLTKTLWLRCAEGTNNASNLVVDKVVLGGASNVLTPALRVLFVATSSVDESQPKRISACVYDAGTGEFTYSNDNDNFFDTVLGNEAEEIKVDVYIYFDGTDEIAMNATVAGQPLNGQTIEIYFGIDEVE